MNDYERDRIKILIELLRCINYFDCVNSPSFTQRRAKEAADCIEELATSLNALEIKLEECQGKLSELLCYMTGGRFSKTTYSIEEMKRFVDDYQQEMCEKCDEVLELKTELEQVKYETEQHI